MSPLEYTVLHLFGGSGGGARGFLRARLRLFARDIRFRCLGSIDSDAIACRDFRRLTGTDALCRLIETVTPVELRAYAGDRRPDCVFGSAPCKGGSRLLSDAKAKTPKYAAMNRLALVAMQLVLETWDEAPPLILFENVPGLTTRAPTMIRELRALLRSRGYVLSESTHDCGELGGLAQHRDRWLLVGRQPKACSSLVYQPPKRKVRACGEVLGTLPIPTTPGAQRWGKLHELPRLSWRNWLRLSLIPPGGDWRDLDGVLAGRARREVFRRHAVAAWEQPIPAVTGPGGHSVEAVADVRVEGAHRGVYGVLPWTAPGPVITGAADNPSSGRFSVADPRLGFARPPFRKAYGVIDWRSPAGTVTGEAQGPSNGAFGIADPRALELGFDERTHWNKYRVEPWSAPAGTVIGKTQPGSGAPAVADPRTGELRVPVAYDKGYGVLAWGEPARTVAGTNPVGAGAYAVADPRDRSALDAVLLTLDEAMALDLPLDRPPPFWPVIVAESGCWHRPMTLLELACLQSLPPEIDGEPLYLEGTRTEIATHVGNMVPEAAALAIAERFLPALAESDLGGFSLSGDLAVWVVPMLEQLAAEGA